MVLERLLQNVGFHVRVAADGPQGVELFRTLRPHFIWMDLRMPVMDGMATARHIRALDGGREVKIAAVTASAFADQRSDVLAAGMDDFVSKPYRPSEIFDCIARQLGVRYRRSEAVPASFGAPAGGTEPASAGGTSARAARRVSERRDHAGSGANHQDHRTDMRSGIRRSAPRWRGLPTYWNIRRSSKRSRAATIPNRCAKRRARSVLFGRQGKSHCGLPMNTDEHG